MTVDRRPRGVTGALVLLTLGLPSALTGCREVVETAPAVHEPAVVEEVAGLDVKRVHFDRRGAAQVDLRTAPVVRDGRETVVPYAALIYDAEGTSWVYLVRGPQTFQRHRVAVARIEGDRVWLRAGPPVGAEVVTRGAAEVYGAELGVAGGH